MNFVCCNGGKHGEKHSETCEYGTNQKTREMIDAGGTHPSATSQPREEKGMNERRIWECSEGKN